MELLNHGMMKISEEKVMKDNFSLCKKYGTVLLYLLMLAAVCVFFEGNGTFIYEAF